MTVPRGGPSLNPMTGWYDADVATIETGITLVMAENLRTGVVLAWLGMLLLRVDPSSAQLSVAN